MNHGIPAPALRPRDIAEVVAAVRAHAKLLPIGAGTKSALAAAPEGCALMSLCGLSGIVEYDPCEYTFTALAGTPLRDVAAALARHGQHLPFDPPFGDTGATLGGCIGAGLSGPGRQRYGGVRDFILGVRFVTGAGELVRGGGKVVKNAAGFDLPKLLVGSLGRLGAIVEATFKVFPQPRATATLRVTYPDLAAALATLTRVGAAPFDIEALELEPPGTLWIRLGGAPETFADRLGRLGRFAAGSSERLEGAADQHEWKRLAPRISGNESELLAKVPLTAKDIPEFDRLFDSAGARRRYSAGGNVAWIAWPGSAASLDALLRSLSLAGLVLSGPATRPLLGATRGDNFRARIKSALDPEGRFPDF
jgi:glycolate oxidase FAD binding subunit